MSIFNSSIVRQADRYSYSITITVTAGGFLLEHGSSKHLNPKPSSLLSGLGIFINASNSPIHVDKMINMCI
jgi:hypothetical protein